MLLCCQVPLVTAFVMILEPRINVDQSHGGEKRDTDDDFAESDEHESPPFLLYS